MPRMHTPRANLFLKLFVRPGTFRKGTEIHRLSRVKGSPFVDLFSDRRNFRLAIYEAR